MIEISKEELAELKSQGFLLMKDKEHFTCRIVFPAGTATAEELEKAASIARKYAAGIITVTVRLNIELPGIPYENIESMKKAVKEAGLSCGGTGAQVRPLVACKGTVCKFGLIDTQGLCMELHNRFYPAEVPHKFKINITGCPNNCAKAQLNDVGFMGAPKNTVRLFIGGRFGRQSIMGEEICRIPVEKAADVTQLCLDFYRENGKPKQRFGVMLQEMNKTEAYRSFIEKLQTYSI